MTSGITSPLKVVVCGSGNGAHVFTALAASRANTEVRVLTTFQNDAERWNQALKGQMMVSYLGKPDDQVMIKSRPALITKDPVEVVPTADVIVIVVPSYVHGPMLTAILPHCRPNTLIAALPAHPGFDFQFTHVFGDKAKECTLVIFETLPWACRIVEFGTHVRILGIKDHIGMAVLKGERSNVPFDCITTLQMLIGESMRLQLVQNCLIANLMAMSMIHPTIMYGKWKDWDGTPVNEIPLFYQGLDDGQADLMSKVSDEILQTAKTIKEKCVEFDLDISPIQHVKSWTIRYYGDQVKDQSSLKSSFQTNQGFNGLVYQMKPAVGGGYVPDFSFRYVREDVPFGLVVWKGIAQIVNVDTPVIDTVICWTQTKLGEEYLVGSELKGRDLHKSRAPQAYGIHTVGQLLRSSAL